MTRMIIVIDVTTRANRNARYTACVSLWSASNILNFPLFMHSPIPSLRGECTRVRACICTTPKWTCQEHNALVLMHVACWYWEVCAGRALSYINSISIEVTIIGWTQDVLPNRFYRSSPLAWRAKGNFGKQNSDGIKFKYNSPHRCSIRDIATR